MKPPKSGSRNLSIDIETFPLLGYSWTNYDTNIIKIVEPTSICCFSAKWLNGQQITKALPDYKGYKPGSRNDKHLIEELWELLDQADVVIAHNGIRFDVRKINARFTYWGLKPPSPYKVVDTLRQAKRIGSYDSNKLNDLGEFHDLGKKISTGGLELWFDCLAGNMSAWKHMKQYNAQDVILLEKVYLKLLPWMPTHPNVATLHGPEHCPKCGSGNLHSRGQALNATTRYQRYQCYSCGAWCREVVNTLKKEDKPFVNTA